MLVRVKEWEIGNKDSATGTVRFYATVTFKEIDSEGKIFSSDKFNITEFINYTGGFLDNESLYDGINEAAVRIGKKLMERYEF